MIREGKAARRLLGKSSKTPVGQQSSPSCFWPLVRARILKHSMEAEKSTFQAELSFQRSECTAGLTVATSFVLLIKTILSKQFRKTLKSAKMIYICILYLKSLETYLETLHSHFQPNCYFKMFKNSGSEHFQKRLYESHVCVDDVLSSLLK